VVGRGITVTLPAPALITQAVLPSGVIAMPEGPAATVIALPTLSVAVLIGITLSLAALMLANSLAT
jgi:hypothetical protein